VVDWLVITADDVDAGRGVRGYALVWFLETYFGKRQVAALTPDEFRKSPIAASTLCLGLPSSQSAKEIEQLIRNARPRRVAVFDYLDQHELAWTAEQAAVLRRHTDLYLKPWFEPAWNYDLRMGLLPLRIRSRMSTAVTLDRIARRLGRKAQPRHDVAFLGRPNRTRLLCNGEVEKYDQRLIWLRELQRQAPELKFWGGLSRGDDPDHVEQVAQFGDFSDLRYPAGKARFGAFWKALSHSRVLLAPGGNVPWTYRHYECLYAGGVVVTIDYRQRDMLIPLPVDLMVHVPDRAAVLPSIREALEYSEARPWLRDDVYVHLDRYLKRGAYSADRPHLIERFRRQFA
jgi:hypothetical protein